MWYFGINLRKYSNLVSFFTHELFIDKRFVLVKKRKLPYLNPRENCISYSGLYSSENLCQ